jgi:hypothetical protein
MSSTQSTALKPAFLKTVQDLVKQRDNLAGASIQFKKMWIDFCVSYAKAYDEADKLGMAAVKHLNDRVGNIDQPTLSKMRQVARAMHALGPKVLGALPPSREALVALARAEITKPGTIQRLTATGKVTYESSVREIRDQLHKKRSRITEPTTVQAEHRVTVTFPSGEDAAEPLADLLLKTGATIAVADDKLRDAIKHKIGKERFWEGKFGERLT